MEIVVGALWKLETSPFVTRTPGSYHSKTITISPVLAPCRHQPRQVQKARPTHPPDLFCHQQNPRRRRYFQFSTRRHALFGRFPPSVGEFHQAHVSSRIPCYLERFKKHQSFCLSNMGRFQVVLAFDIETRRMFFGTESFLAEDAYVRRWHQMDMDISHKEIREAVKEGAAAAAVREAAKLKSGHRFHPYRSTS
ncbi:hypothetical protein EDB19DRAFT_2004745 [Suillus lakei]|nr:hypothetical protein EDB19DRAFT_2004745 [Suillus lakei]